MEKLPTNNSKFALGRGSYANFSFLRLVDTQHINDKTKSSFIVSELYVYLITSLLVMTPYEPE